MRTNLEVFAQTINVSLVLAAMLPITIHKKAFVSQLVYKSHCRVIMFLERSII